MDILDEAKEEVQIERFVRIYKRYGKYLVSLLFMVLVCSVFYFWWQNHQGNVTSEEASEYNDALSAEKASMISKLENLKVKKTIYAQLAHLQLAGIYADEKDFNKAVHNYEQLINRGGVDHIYLDYAKLMLAKTKSFAGIADGKATIELFDQYLSTAVYFKNIARLEKAALLINQGDIDKAHAELDFIVTDANAPPALVNIAQVIQKSAVK
jgi:predicted negative regulator of RcsB-dependent stress response